MASGPLVEAQGNFRGAAWGDFDSDGDLDVLLCRYDSQVSPFFRNNGDGTFTQTTAGPVSAQSGSWLGAAWADYDNDGLLDLIVCSLSASDDRLFRNNGDGTFTRITAGPFGSETAGSVTPAWADYDNDGWVDLFVSHAMWESNLLYHNNGTGGFTLVGQEPSGGGPGLSGHAAWSDFDNDGDLDLFVANGIGEQEDLDLLYRNEGGGTFTSLANDPVVSHRAYSRACAWGDYDNDGFPDLFVANLDDPEYGGTNRLNWLYHNLGNGSFERVTHGGPAEDIGNSTAACWGDYDNDGDLDLFVTNDGADHFLYRNTGVGDFTRVESEEVTANQGYATSTSWVDYDGDGDLDLFIAYGVAGQGVSVTRCSLFRNNGTTNTWLKIRLVGTSSNRSAIGARVATRHSVDGKEIRQIREVVSGGFAQCLVPGEVHFGLGDATNVTTLRIEWPSGIVQEMTNVATSQILTITEPAQLVPLRPREFQIRCWKGMRFVVEKSLDLRTWDSLGAVTNETGTLVFQDTQTDPQAACCFYRVRLKNDL